LLSKTKDVELVVAPFTFAVGSVIFKLAVTVLPEAMNQ